MVKLITILLVLIPMFSHAGITNDIQKELRWTGYNAKPTTIQYAKRNHNGSWLNCIQYSYRIKDICDKNKVESHIYQVTPKHAIITVKDGTKEVTYSNGKVVNKSNYSIQREIKLR